MSISRHELREQTFKMLFGIEFHEDEDKREALNNYMDITIERRLTPFEREEIIERVLSVDAKRDVLDATINRVAKGWKTSRMGKAELNLIRLALYEMKYDDSVPVKVAINEAVELGKEYGDDDAPSFINGLLARLIDEQPESETGSSDSSSEQGEENPLTKDLNPGGEEAFRDGGLENPGEGAEL